MSAPLWVLDLPWGKILTLKGFAANDVTHCVKPHEIKYKSAFHLLVTLIFICFRKRHTVITLRHVAGSAPRYDFLSEIISEL